MQNNNYFQWNEILFDEWQRCFDKALFPHEKKSEVQRLPIDCLLIRFFYTNGWRSTSAGSATGITTTHGNTLAGITVFIGFTGFTPGTLAVILTIIMVSSHMAGIYSAT
jgi:hypothetical protein